MYVLSNTNEKRTGLSQQQCAQHSQPHRAVRSDESIPKMKTIGNQPIATCIHCQQPLNVYVQCSRLTGECKNKQCRRVYVTMDIETLQGLSNADLDAKGYPDYSVKLAVAV